VATADYRLSGPYTHDNLSVYLVHGPETLPGASFLTLQEALGQKKAVVHETGSVNQLAVENLSEGEEVFVQSGDIVKGGKQDRTLPYDAVIAAGSGRVPIDSFCVEQGRWSKREGARRICCGPSACPPSRSGTAAVAERDAVKIVALKGIEVRTVHTRDATGELGRARERHVERFGQSVSGREKTLPVVGC
jgi:hypothetical protein